MNNRNEPDELRFPRLVWPRVLWMVCLIGAAALVGPGPASFAQAQAQAPAPASKASSAPSGNAENGKRVYVAKGCWECHDYEGQGGAGPRIGPPRLSLTALTAYIRQPKGQMPPYQAKVLSDSDAADIYAFLQSVPKPVPVKSTPLLDY
jgi:mono/diheme cytochrome c family protein